MKKCNEEIDMHFSKRLDTPLTLCEILLYRAKKEEAYKAFQKFAFKVFAAVWIVLTALSLLVVLDLEMTTDEILYYILILIIGFPFVGSIFASSMEADYVRDRCPTFQWNIKSKNRIAFNDGIYDISGDEYVKLKIMADQNQNVMDFVKQIASQERQPIKAELCMLKNFMNEYPVNHAKEMLGLA
jgi:hypothetical protein